MDKSKGLGFLICGILQIRAMELLEIFFFPFLSPSFVWLFLDLDLSVCM